MSYTEFHKGKLRVLTRSTKETLDYIEKNNLQEAIKESSYCYETDFDVQPDYEDKYIILYKDAKFHGDEVEHMLCEFIEHFEREGGDDDLCEIKRVSRDEYEFLCGFYNGGTWLGEILSGEISRLEKQEWNSNEDTITITSRESYMIMDCINYVLNNMIINGMDYLQCNYSREEIAKCGQRFGDLNLKNQW